MLHQLLSLFMIPIVSLSFLTNLFHSNRVLIEGSAMSPTLVDGDMILHEPFEPDELERFDIVVCHFPNRGNALFVERVVGLPGDTVEILNGILYVNGIGYQEDYVTGRPQNFSAISVPEGCYFLMGDNRANSRDSRFEGVGPLPLDMIVGRVTEITNRDADLGKPVPIDQASPAEGAE